MGIPKSRAAFLIISVALRLTETQSPTPAPTLFNASIVMVEPSVAQWHT